MYCLNIYDEDTFLLLFLHYRFHPVEDRPWVDRPWVEVLPWVVCRVLLLHSALVHHLDHWTDHAQKYNPGADRLGCLAHPGKIRLNSIKVKAY